MLNENIKNLRKSKGLSQEELAIKLNVVRQTVSKWENLTLTGYNPNLSNNTFVEKRDAKEGGYKATAPK